MKNIYLFLFLLPCFFLSGCSKNVLERYENRIIGTWELYDIDNRGIFGGGSITHQVFQPGIFTFNENNTVTYVLNGVTYNGGWDIDRYTRVTNCHTDEDGDQSCNYDTDYPLFISVTEPVSQYNRTETFDNMNFSGSNSFKAYDEHFVFRFRRQ